MLSTWGRISKDINMKKSGIVLASCIAAAYFNMPVMAQEYIDCNMAGAGKFKSEEQGAHVFWARLGNNGKGNGGEAVDVTLVSGVTTTITCVGTADEDTGGALTLPELGIVIENSEALPEIDNGPGAPRP
jgi:hypothetical protein